MTLLDIRRGSILLSSGRSRKRSVLVAGHETSVSLEPPFWDALKEIADTRGVSLNTLVTELDRGRAGNLSSALRIFVLEEMQSRARR